MTTSCATHASPRAFIGVKGRSGGDWVRLKIGRARGRELLRHRLIASFSITAHLLRWMSPMDLPAPTAVSINALRWKCPLFRRQLLRHRDSRILISATCCTRRRAQLAPMEALADLCAAHNAPHLIRRSCPIRQRQWRLRQQQRSDKRSASLWRCFRMHKHGCGLQWTFRRRTISAAGRYEWVLL